MKLFLGEGDVVICVLCEPFHKSRVICFGSPKDIRRNFQKCFFRGSDTLFKHLAGMPLCLLRRLDVSENKGFRQWI